MISVVILTKNAENSIQQAIESVSWADEVIVVDDNSTDTTHKIVKDHKALLWNHALENDFSQQRIFGLEKAKGDWVLFIDDDERVSPKLRDEIRKEIARNETTICGYYIKRIDIVWGKELKHGETGNATFLRLARKNFGIWKDPVHEYWDIQGRTPTLKNPLYHNPHKNISEFIRKINLYSTIRANYLFKNNIKESPLAIFGKPFGKCMFNLIILQGYKDGTIGVIHALLMSFHSYLVRAKVWELNNKIK